VRVIPACVPQNPYFKTPISTNKDTYKYKMVNKETQLQTTNLEKKYFIRKNDLKTYKNKELKEPDPVHSLFLKNAHAI
jgi:hypothetical protein